MPSIGNQRLLTGLLGTPVVLAAIFLLPGEVFFALMLILFCWAADEFSRIVRHWTPSAPLRALWVLIPLLAIPLFLLLRQPSPTADPGLWLAGVLGAVVGVAAVLVLLGRTDIREGALAIGFLAFATPYFAVPAACLYRMQVLSPWLVFLLLAIVWLGDTAAYYAGSRLGRHKMSPVVSPKKTWEGAAAGLLTSLVATAIWSVWRLGELSLPLLAVALVTAVAAQLGDLVESLFKRGAGVKDSSALLPGHGGILDRLDAMLLAAPVFLVALTLFGLTTLTP